MDMVEEVKNISQMKVSRDLKIKLLQDVMLDCYNEMEAQDQNMHPEVIHNNAEGYRLAKDKIRELEEC